MGLAETCPPKLNIKVGMKANFDNLEEDTTFPKIGLQRPVHPQVMYPTAIAEAPFVIFPILVYFYPKPLEAMETV